MHKILLWYILGILIGALNGFFTSGAGQILVFYLVFIKKYETHMSRALSIVVLSVSSIISLFFHIDFSNIDYIKIIIVIAIGLIFGFIGTKLMKKIQSNVLNLISGILVAGLSLYKFIEVLVK